MGYPYNSRGYRPIKPMREGEAGRVLTFAGRTAAVIGMMAGFSAGGPAVAQSTVVGDTFTLETYQIPLPEGRWVVAAGGTRSLELPSAEVPALIRDAVLLQPQGLAIGAFVVVHANLLPLPADWGLSRDCLAPAADLVADAPHEDGGSAVIFERQHRHYRCAFVKDFTVAEAGPPAASWSAAMTFARRRGWRVPDRWVVAGFRIADGWGVLEVRYGFDPRALAVPAEQRLSRLSPELQPLPAAATLESWAAETDETTALARKSLAAWAVAVRTPVERGFLHRLDEEPALPMPWLDTDVFPPLATVDRLRQLTKLRDNGWIDDQSFRAQRSILLRPVEVETETVVNIWQLGLWKTAVHRLQSSVWSFGINYIVLGNAYLAGGLTATKAVFSTARYYLHELAWNTWGPRRNREVPVIDFAPTVAAR
ncbi:MAG: DUF2061 domain-containing protein [Azospirillum sp.]|nr:DUF2061 domain-containing protein [Azospirillum sp.]